MISAAADVVAKPIGELLGFDDVIATEMSFDDCNKLTLNFKTPNCYGVEKTNRYNDLLDKKEDLKQCNTQVTFYSDSYSDLAMFNLAHVKVAVHPDRKLTQHAVEKGWKIVRW